MHPTKWRCLKLGLKRECTNLAFVPRHRGPRDEDIEKLSLFLANKQKLVVLTGAGTVPYTCCSIHNKRFFFFWETNSIAIAVVRPFPNRISFVLVKFERNFDFSELLLGGRVCTVQVINTGRSLFSLVCHVLYMRSCYPYLINILTRNFTLVFHYIVPPMV